MGTSKDFSRKILLVITLFKTSLLPASGINKNDFFASYGVGGGRAEGFKYRGRRGIISVYDIYSKSIGYYLNKNNRVQLNFFEFNGDMDTSEKKQERENKLTIWGWGSEIRARAILLGVYTDFELSRLTQIKKTLHFRTLSDYVKKIAPIQISDLSNFSREFINVTSAVISRIYHGTTLYAGSGVGFSETDSGEVWVAEEVYSPKFDRTKVDCEPLCDMIELLDNILWKQGLTDEVAKVTPPERRYKKKKSNNLAWNFNVGLKYIINKKIEFNVLNLGYFNLGSVRTMRGELGDKNLSLHTILKVKIPFQASSGITFKINEDDVKSVIDFFEDLYDRRRDISNSATRYLILNINKIKLIFK